MLHVIVNPEISETLWSKLLPTIISGVLLVSLFIVGRLIENRIKRKELKQNWYLKVIIEPNISRIDRFIEKSHTSLLNSIRELEIARTLPHVQYIETKSTEIGKFQKIKRNFEFGFLLIVGNNYPNLDEALTDMILELEDQITVILDNENTIEDDFGEIEKSTNNYKSELINLLYSQLAFK